MSVLLVASWLAVPGLAVAEDLPPEKIAAIQRDERAAQARVSAAHGNRKPSELSNEERRQLIQEQQAAGQEVLKKHGVSDKDYSRQVTQLGREELAAVAQAEKKLEAEEQAAREAAAEKPPEAREPEEIPIQLGISDNNPVELESTKEAEPMVEQGLPPGEQGLEEVPAGAAGGTEITPEATFEIPVK
jgi:hypothetical protein